MSPERTEMLVTGFPILYQLRRAPITEALMAFGFECDDGWFDIIRHLSLVIEKWNHDHPDSPVRAVQVKEKYGGLRFYADHEPDEISEAIDEAEKLSYKTCEITGKPGRLCRKSGWYKTLCVEQAEKHGFKPVTEAE